MASWRQQFIEATEKLAMEPPEQRSYLQSAGEGGCLDELALLYDDCLGVHGRQLSGRAHELAHEIGRLTGLIEGEERWRVEALDSKEWSEIRVRARALLSVMESGG